MTAEAKMECSYGSGKRFLGEAWERQYRQQEPEGKVSIHHGTRSNGQEMTRERLGR